MKKPPKGYPLVHNNFFAPYNALSCLPMHNFFRKPKRSKVKKKDKTFEFVGITSEKVIIVENIFWLFDTEGLPLDVLFDQCVRYNLMPSWLNFYDEAQKAGWTHKTIINRLDEAIFDVWGCEYRDIVMTKLKDKVFLKNVSKMIKE